MAPRNWSMQDAMTRFSEIVEAARRSSQTVTRHGKPALVVMDVLEYERLRHLEHVHAPSFVDALLAMPRDDGDFPRRNVRMRDLDSDVPDRYRHAIRTALAGARWGSLSAELSHDRADHGILP